MDMGCHPISILFLYKNSPDLDFDDYHAYQVGSDGVVYDNWYVMGSYGRLNSPYTYPNYEYGFVVHPTGDVGNSYDSPVGFGSCGLNKLF